jgi:hypothetical protein
MPPTQNYGFQPNSLKASQPMPARSRQLPPICVYELDRWYDPADIRLDAVCLGDVASFCCRATRQTERRSPKTQAKTVRIER